MLSLARRFSNAALRVSQRWPSSAGGVCSRCCCWWAWRLPQRVGSDWLHCNAPGEVLGRGAVDVSMLLLAAAMSHVSARLRVSMIRLMLVRVQQSFARRTSCPGRHTGVWDCLALTVAGRCQRCVTESRLLASCSPQSCRSLESQEEDPDVSHPAVMQVARYLARLRIRS